MHMWMYKYDVYEVTQPPHHVLKYRNSQVTNLGYFEDSLEPGHQNLNDERATLSCKAH